ncbi:MAG TPA: Chromate resistance protein ChrB [Chloroflexota bacterium]|nr:Chromate resistance protein ChrB [Chloroflexota bacterium]
MPTWEWSVLVYRVPSEPASKRVAIWRDLKKLGALYLQQCVCILPRLAGVTEALDQVNRKIEGMGGEALLLQVPAMVAGDERKVVASFRELRNKEYAEIVEECETKFVKEIEFERFRENYTFEEAEEIQQDLEKIRRWYETVKARDWFDAEGSLAALAWLDRCAAMYARFEEDVYQRVNADPLAEQNRSARGEQ